MLQVIEGTEVVWAKPSGSGPPKGLLLAFHGCSHAAIDWFPRSDSCKDCIGVWAVVGVQHTLSHLAGARPLCAKCIAEPTACGICNGYAACPQPQAA
jgi:hypothetical protein